MVFPRELRELEGRNIKVESTDNRRNRLICLAYNSKPGSAKNILVMNNDTLETLSYPIGRFPENGLNSWIKAT